MKFIKFVIENIKNPDEDLLFAIKTVFKLLVVVILFSMLINWLLTLNTIISIVMSIFLFILIAWLGVLYIMYSIDKEIGGI